MADMKNGKKKKAAKRKKQLEKMIENPNRVGMSGLLGGAGRAMMKRKKMLDEI